MNKVLKKIDTLRAILRDSNLSTPRRVELLAEINRLQVSLLGELLS